MQILGLENGKKMEKWPMIQSLEMNEGGMSDSIRRNRHRKMSHNMRPNGQNKTQTGGKQQNKT